LGPDTGEQRISAALRGSPPGLWPFIPAGFPDLSVTADLLARLGELPIRGVEVGIPFSDPIADGPVIQHAFSRALEAGVRVAGVLAMVSRVRPRVPCPILAMISASIVYRLGVERFAREAASAGFDGLIIPDLSLEEAPGVSAAARGAGLAMPMLVAPTTPPQRQRRIAAAASGFLYYVSIQGVTGERDALPADLAANVASLRSAAGLPVLIGFGLSRPAHVAEACRIADGAIVGSAIVRRMIEASRLGGGAAGVVAQTVVFVGELATSEGLV